jgi:DNA-binding CsgD family transcriptional regulator
LSAALQIGIITVSILAGLFSIVAVHQMSQKYRLPYLSTFFYFLIFLNIFGIYGIIVSRIIREILIQIDVDTDSIESISMIINYLGIPFLILSLYMFLRFCREFVNRNLSTGFNLFFFITQILMFLIYGLIMIRISRFGETRFDFIKKGVLIVYTVISSITCLYAMIQMLFIRKQFTDAKERLSIRFFCLVYLFFIAAIITSANLACFSRWIELTFIILLFASHLIPIFILDIHLDKFYIEPAITVDFQKCFEDFIRKFGISGREKEVIELICKGKSNQEISDSLFISLQTVKDHIHRIYTKTGVKNRVQLSNLIRTFS